MNELPAVYTTLPSLCAAYQKSKAEVEQAFSLMASAEQRLKSEFCMNDQGSYAFGLMDDIIQNRIHNDEIKSLFLEMKKDAWRVLIDKMGIRQVLSIKAAEELDKQLGDGKDLPEIEYTAVLAMLEQCRNNVGNYLEEAVKEVFDWLRPRSSKYKTNSEFEIGRRVVLGWCVDVGYGSNFHVNYHREANLRALDNVFHAMDGKGMIKTHGGPLCDAVNQTPLATGKGETDYFKFRCFLNNNMHLEFKRLDLLAKLNQVAGGMRLKPNF